MTLNRWETQRQWGVACDTLYVKLLETRMIWWKVRPLFTGISPFRQKNTHFTSVKTWFWKQGQKFHWTCSCVKISWARPFHPIPWLLIGIRMLTGLGVHGPLDEWVKQCVGPPFTKSLSWRTWLQKTMVYDTYNLKLVTYNYSIQGETKPTKRTEGPTLKVAQVIKRPAGWQTVFLTNSRVCKWVANKCTHCLWLIRMTLLFDGEPPLCLFLWDQPRSGQLDCRIFLVFTGYYIYISFLSFYLYICIY